MKNTLRKRIVSGLLAGLMCISNISMPVSAADFLTDDSEKMIETEYQEETDTEMPENSGETDMDLVAETEETAFEENDQVIDMESEGNEEKIAMLAEDGTAIVPEAAEDGISLQASTETFQVSGSIAYNDTLDGTDWSSLVRPAEFDQPMKVTLKYKDTNGQDQEITYDVQDHLSQEAFYLKFTHDGNGGGDFTITNIPKTITDADGKTCSVTACEISIAPTLPYYQNEQTISVNPNDITTALGTVTLSLKYQTLILCPTVVPSGTDNPTFVMKAVFTNTNQESRTLDKTYRVSSNQQTSLKVPLNMDYKITQQQTSGYRFDGKYHTKSGDTDETESLDSASGSITKDITITTVNYAQNVTAGFDVIWIDNHKASRPTLSENQFILQYQTEENGEWTNLTSEKYGELGITKAPGFDNSRAALNQYAYTGLPAANAEGKQLNYRVVVASAPEGYGYEYQNNEESGKDTITFREQTDFSAEIVWNDASASESRPENIASLNLYRRVGDGNFEKVYEQFPNSVISKNVMSWKVNITDLPRYNEDNQEYDYVLIQGTIDDDIRQETVDGYKTYYDNGSGNFGNDIKLCHNGGKITEVLYAKEDFQATKVWKDTNDTEQRPDATVTLWRYVGNTAKSIDDAYEKGLASQVVFQTQTDGTITEQVVAYSIDKTKNTGIVFSHDTISALPENYEFPAYDDQGRKYVYFARESLSGTYADDYEIQYSNGTEVYHNGAPTGGTITNLHRKKEEVSITKLWQNPSGLAAIEGVSVQVAIKASADNGKTFDDLTVYSGNTGSYEELTGDQKKAAQTISGFSSSLAQGEISYYVNTCNSEGKPYDMASAQITETVITSNGTTIIAETDENGNTTFTMNGQTYRVKNSYEGSNTLGNNTTQHRYRLTNTITAEKTYKLIKEWAQSIPQDEIEGIKSVNFKLERRSMKTNADGTESSYEEVKNEDGQNVWTVEKTENGSWESTLTGLPGYDEEGYAYYYRATEISFTKTDETTQTTGEAYNQNKWAGAHYRTSDQTKVINYKVTTEGRGYFSVSKIWQDNGDTEARKSVKVRVYKRNDLKTALNNLENDLEMNLDQLTNLKYYETTITSQEQYTVFIYYKNLETEIDGQEWSADQKDDWRNYVVLEYSVGEETQDGVKPAQYTVSQLRSVAEATGEYGITGTVENADRQYQVTIAVDKGDTSGYVFLTNTRTGTTELSLEKSWKDENNATGLRPSEVRFQLYQDGKAYKNIPETVVVQNTEETAETVELEHSTGVLTVSSATGNNKAEKWSVHITGLKMFSAVGIPYSYDMEELAEENATDTAQQYSYLLKKAMPVVNSTGKTQNYTFSFTNTISGTVEHVAYKYWKDTGIGASNRPDLYMNLYQYLKKDQRENPNSAIDKLQSCKLYKDYKDQIWSAQPQSSSENDYETGYNWKITVEGLPRFDEQGEEYGYLFKESMNNDGKTVMGTYQSQAETKTSDVNATDPDTYEVFTNTITDTMTIQGKKTWTGLSGYQTKEEDLPDPVITLYRTTDASVTNLQNKLQNKSDEEITQLIDDKTIELVNTTTLTNNKTRYVFENVAKFDAEGRRYIYLVRETIKESVAGQLYSQVNVNGTLSNVFRQDVNRRNIEVTKKWEGRDNIEIVENKYPSVTYTLYRYELGKEAETSTQIATHTINANEFTGTDGTASYTFRDLLVYSPTGVQYGYYVTEKKISGYAVTYQDEDGLTDSTLNSNERMDVTSLPAKWNDANASEDDLTVHVGTTNTYSEAGKITISGKKIWKDENNSEKLRPDKITITLKRSTNNESGQNNKVDSNEVPLEEKESQNETMTEPYIVWNKGSEPGSSDSWTYTIYNLQRYAPNGMPYTYTIAEQQVTGYQQTNVVNHAADADQITMAAITNQYAGSYYVRKNWMDGNNKYNLRPAEITIQLQRTTGNDDSAGWTDYRTPVTLSKANEIKNTRGNSWEYTFTNLPTQDKDEKKYQYRCVEKTIGGVEIKSTTENGETRDTAGAYVCTYPTQNDERTVIENTLNATSLVVTKKWKDDQDNLYQTRPDSLTFVLQKRSIKVADRDETSTDTTEETQLSDWMNVTNADGSPYTFTIAPDRNGEWKYTLEDLPVAEVQTDADGTTYTVYSLYFRAKEVHTADNTSITSGAQNYQDTTDYSTSTTNNAHKYDEAQGCNISTITNELRLDNPVRSISVTKNWRRKDDAKETSATFELLYKKQSESEDSWHSYDPALEQTVNTGSPQNLSVVKWGNLPAYDLDGEALVYKVTEHPVAGYRTEVTESVSGSEVNYTFTNIQLQNYTVKKIWKNTDYAQKTEEGYTATFRLQQKIGNATNWTDVENSEITLTSTTANDQAQKYTWSDLPMYTVEGNQIQYRAVETGINGISVIENTNGAYNVSYTYSANETQNNSRTEPAFGDTVTVAENRMIYGFVNLTKTAAYLAPGLTGNNDQKLQDAIFELEKDGKVYASEIKTDEKGNLRNTDGKYGKEEKYLIAGTYTLKEVSAGTDYSVWENGVTFTVGTGNISGNALTATGEHGTAWITTTFSTTISASLQLGVEYQKAVTENGTEITEHTFGDSCKPASNTTSYAYDLESRGVLTFTKTGANGTPLDTHIGATGESSAYFGVYLDQACTQQVAGMVPNSTDRTIMVLTDKMQDGTTGITAMRNTNDIPYLRAYNNTSHSEYPFTLLSGTYYIKELVAPAGYKLDNSVRKAVVGKIEKTAMNQDLSDLYADNKAQIMKESEQTGSSDYQWSNEPNVLTLYKMDQYGRKVPLKENGYLKLKLNETGSTFPSGSSEIFLYQNQAKPAAAGNTPTEIGNICYNAENGSWTITGLLDSGKTYTLSEPETSVHDHYLVANAITFRMNEDGSIELVEDSSGSNSAQEKNNPLTATGTDYQNYYKSDITENLVVLRDVARYLKDVALQKTDSKTNASIANISFELYKYDEKDENGKPKNVRPVLQNGSYLTTDQNGKIDLKVLSDNVKNQITGCALKYGLDIGNYYFKEVERGASDKYRLSDEIFFEIKSDEPQSGDAEYSNYAKVEFQTGNSHVTVEQDGKTVIVKNDPVSSEPKTLNLIKTDSQNADSKLNGARFTLSYQSVNHGDDGAETANTQNLTWNCVTDADGTLVLCDENGQIQTDADKKSEKPDISRKGTYTLKEIQAPDSYMTRTENGTMNPVTMVTFQVNAENQIVNVTYYGGQGTLVTGQTPLISTDTKGEQMALNLSVKNEKTKVSVEKLSDIVGNTKTCNQKLANGEMLSDAELQIYEGIYSANTSEQNLKSTLETNQSGWILPEGALKENTIYTLHESSAPVGYLAAEDIYFMLFGTTQKGNDIVSQIYVWDGPGAPSGNVTDSGWKKDRNLKDSSLAMVDEAIIAPVDVKKVVGSQTDEIYQVLPGAEFEVKAGNDILGKAVSSETGYLVWKEISTNGYDAKLIFNESGKRITTVDENSVVGKTIILQQNEEGYTFTEIYAPDQAYNKGESFTVKITAENYQAYRNRVENRYDGTIYVNLKKAGNSQTHTVSQMSKRTDEAAAATDTDLVNPLFETTFQIYKYDAEHAQITENHNNYEQIGMKGVTFTLAKRQANSDSYVKVGDYTTGENGLLSVTIKEKGTYQLKESSSLPGYQINGTVMEFTIMNEDYQKTLTYSTTSANHTTILSSGEGAAEASVYALANYRQHGTVTLTKQDADSKVKLNGVRYSLTRIMPDVNGEVDHYFPSQTVTSLTVETGKMYSKIATAKKDTEIQIQNGEQGVLTLQDLQWGTYKLTEEQETDGYILDSKEYEFVINGNNLNIGVTDTGKGWVENTKNQLTIKKVAVQADSDSTLTQDAVQQLEGAEFILYPVTKQINTETGTETLIMSEEPAVFYTSATAEEKAATVTIKAGTTTIYGLVKGSYVLRENKAPDGYELTRDVIFELSDRGVVSDAVTCTVNAENRTIKKDENGSNVVSLITAGNGSSATNTLTIADVPITVSLTKKLLDQKQQPVEIAGRGTATFEITGIFADTPEKTNAEKRSFTTNNITDELKAKLIGGQTYILTETSAPGGYKIPEESAKISVGVDGTISVIQGESFLSAENRTDGTAAMTFTDQPIVLNLVKTDESGKVIDQQTLGYAEFCVSGEFVKKDGSGMEETTIKNLTTNNFSSELSGRVVAGKTYTVFETFAPKGYKLTDSFSFQINSYGKITNVSGTDADSKNSSNQDSDTLTIRNHPNQITFRKKDDNGYLAGARFTLEAAVKIDETVFVNMDENNRPEATKPDSNDNWGSWTDTKIQWTSTNEETGFTLTNHLIAGVSYKLHEERLRNHEVMANDIIFHLEKDGIVVIDTNAAIPNNTGDAANVEADHITMTIQNPLIRGSVVLTKYFSSEGQNYQTSDVLAGAVYELYCTEDQYGVSHIDSPIQVKTNEADGYDVNGTKARFTTGPDGKITITNLPEGQYYFREVDAPSAYYINESAISFAIQNGTDASVEVQAVDPRVNVKISVKKFSGTSILSDAKFDVAYSEKVNGTYFSIGQISTDTNGEAVLTNGIYREGDGEETLRRGFYRLTELSADGQMLNTTDGIRNTISFEIGNVLDKTYEIKTDTDVNYTVEGEYVRLDENGIIDTSIPEKTITVVKRWQNDNGMDQTFRSKDIQVQLYRSYKVGETDVREAVGEPKILNAQNQWTCSWENQPSYVNVANSQIAGEQSSCLYTYTVEEKSQSDWYTVNYTYTTKSGNAAEQTVPDGDTEVVVTNTLIGGEEAKDLTITKALGGGSQKDAFKVRVRVSHNGASSVEQSEKYYLDNCKVSGDAQGADAVITPDENGWITIHGGETITVKLPKGADYEVEEQTDRDGYAVTESAEKYRYIPRYDNSTRTGTMNGTADAATTIRNAVQKTIELSKVGEDGKALNGAEYEVTYVPAENVTNPETVMASWTEKNCVVNADGKLTKEDGSALDITMQGRYYIRETKAPFGYLTPTTKDGASIVLAVITVNKQDILSVQTGIGNADASDNANALALVTLNGTNQEKMQKDGSVASFTVKNEKTRVRIGKTIDYAKAQNVDAEEGSYLVGAKLQILKKGQDSNELIAEWTTTNQPFMTEPGDLTEGEIYLLREVDAPVGYQKASDQYFKLEGTYTVSDNDGRLSRYARILMTDQDGNVLESQNINGSNYGDAGVIDGVLHMADETIIAPVNLQKVLESADHSSRNALADVEFTVQDLDTQKILGTTVTAQSGYLSWKEITAEGYASGLIYDEAGHRVLSDGNAGKIILKQNRNGYAFTESYAPDGVYNNGQSYHVSITARNYRQYRTANKTGTLYNSNLYINLARSEVNTDHQVEDLSVIGDQAEPQVVNLMSASFELTKKVEGNMGDQNGIFQIHMKIFEPDGKTLIEERSIELRANERYDSESGWNGKEAFGKDAIPVGAVLEITEELTTKYDSRIEVRTDGTATVLSRENGIIKVRLNTSEKASLELVNRKDAVLDVGVYTDHQVPTVFATLLIPAFWLAWRRRKKYRGGGEEQ